MDNLARRLTAYCSVSDDQTFRGCKEKCELVPLNVRFQELYALIKKRDVEGALKHAVAIEDIIKRA